MKKNMKKLAVMVFAALMIGSVLTGCSGKASKGNGKPFSKGVYAYYEKADGNAPQTYFYVFEDDEYGYTSDAEYYGTGVPFRMEQSDSEVRFSMGGEDGDWLVFTVGSNEDGKVTGSFEDGKEVVFELLPGVESDSFDAEEYVKNH